MHLLPHLTPNASIRGLVLRALAIGVMVILMTVSWQKVVWAGCHYGDSQFAQALSAQDPYGHARKFHFLGQLVYEGGDIKYVPWQATPKCQGPNCRADEPQPESGVAPTSNVQRVNGSGVMVLPASLTDSETSSSWFVVKDISPFTGYPHEHEYPP